jgi:hypothetical protein
MGVREDMTQSVNSGVPGPRGLGLVLIRVVVVVLAFSVFALCCASGALAAGDANESTCPNEALEGFREALPDCRAYEMVTPTYKEGYGFFVAGLSSNGEKMFLDSLGTLRSAAGGSEVVESETTYIGVRTPSGWQISPVNPSLNEYVGQSRVTAEADSGASLWVQHTPTQSATTQDLYVRSPTGEYSLVGPLNTPALSAGEPSNVMEPHQDTAVVATTDDYSHIVLRANAEDRWTSFDGTQGGGYSLYEYNGVGNSQPTLVAVLGSKSSTRLIGQCGAQIGSAEAQGSVFNAISSSGETIFFTPTPVGKFGCSVPAPAVAEVWARLHGGRLTAENAETVDISESRCSEACSPVVSGSNFEGASENGAIAFFTSTQKLTNDASQDPNSEDNASGPRGCAETTAEFGCNLYMYDFKTAPGSNLKLVAGHAEVLGVAGIAENGSWIYFVARRALAGKAIPGEANLYVYDTSSGTTIFIATLNSELDTSDWSREYSRPVEVTPDGRFLLFASSQPDLTPDDTATTEQLFEYDAETGELVRISQGENGYNENGNGAGEESAAGNLEEAAEAKGYPYDYKVVASGSSIADDGMTVVFKTRGRLSPVAVSAEKRCTSVYEYRSHGTIGNGAVHLISDGRDAEPNKGPKCGATFYGMDAEGRNILFSTDDSLLPSDTDGVQRDIYDAREGGGFAVSPSTEALACAFGVCGAATGVQAPAVDGPVSATQAAEANATGTVAHPAAAPRKALTRTERLARALRACRAGRSRHRRASCEAGARKRYGSRIGNRKRGA